jgi:hypothetical protein
MSLTIVIREHEHCGTYNAYLGKEWLCRSRTPLLTSARILLARGVDPDTRLEMRREGSSAAAMAATLSGAANLTVGEPKGPGAIRFRTWRSFEAPGMEFWGIGEEEEVVSG